MDLIRIGNIVTTPELARKLPKRAASIKSWENSVFSGATYKAIRELGVWTESVFNAEHGRSYLLFVIPSFSDRPAALDYLCNGCR